LLPIFFQAKFELLRIHFTGLTVQRSHALAPIQFTNDK
jgi:hypothetical protein